MSHKKMPTLSLFPVSSEGFIQLIEKTIPPYQATLFECTGGGTLSFPASSYISSHLKAFKTLLLKKNLHLEEKEKDLIFFKYHNNYFCLIPLPSPAKKGERLLLKSPTLFLKKDKEFLESLLPFLRYCFNSAVFSFTLLEEIDKYPSTSLLTWHSMAQEMTKRFPQLDQEQRASTLMVIEVENLVEIAKNHGPLQEEAALQTITHFFEKIFSPIDLKARLGQNIFAIWLHGEDRFSSAECANKITSTPLTLPLLKDHPLSFRIGLVCREAQSADTANNLLEQAMIALHTLKKEKRKRWYFAHQHA